MLLLEKSNDLPHFRCPCLGQSSIHSAIHVCLPLFSLKNRPFELSKHECHALCWHGVILTPWYLSHIKIAVVVFCAFSGINSVCCKWSCNTERVPGDRLSMAIARMNEYYWFEFTGWLWNEIVEYEKTVIRQIKKPAHLTIDILQFIQKRVKWTFHPT